MVRDDGRLSGVSPSQSYVLRIHYDAFHCSSGIITCFAGSVAIVIFGNNNTAAIGIKKNFGRVESHSCGRFKWSVCPISVELSGLYARYENMPVMVGAALPMDQF